jgi:RimJ/RimL family protein N-acetyltransferase
MLDAASYRAIERLRDGRSYIIRAQRRDDNIIEALQLQAGPRTFYQADLQGEIIGGARYYIWSRGQADIAFIVGDAYQNNGIASTMLRHLAFIAREAGISDLHAHISPGNRRALRVLDNLGFPRTASPKRNMMHVTLHLTSTTHPGGSRAA